MTPAAPSLAAVMAGVRRTLRRDAVIALCLAALCAVPAALLVAAAIGVLRPWQRPDAGPLLLDLFVAAAVGTLVYRGLRRWVSGIDETAVAADAERTAGMPAGAVRGALELSRNVPEGTSHALARQSERAVGARFAGVAPDGIAAGLVAGIRRRRSLAAVTLTILTLTTVLVGFAAPGHSRAAWAPLANPVGSLLPPPLPALAVQPGDVSASRGTDVQIFVTAAEREMVTVHWRMQGDVPRSAQVPVRGDSAAATIPRIDAVTEYWVEAPDGATSRRYRITPADPLMLADLAVDVVYPAHVNRASDHFQGEMPALEVPAGTQLVIRGRATRALKVAALTAADGAGISFTIEDDAFSGTFTPRSSGTYPWQLQDRAGSAMAVQPAPLDIVILRDMAPQVDIAFPAQDTILDASLRQAVVADARDDFGLASAALVSWRTSRTGQRDAPVELPLTLNGDDRSIIRTLLDAGARGLLPGDTLSFFIRVTDNSAGGQTAQSRTVALRLPGMAEMRDDAAARADRLLTEAESMAEASAGMQEATRALQQRTAAANARRQAQQTSSRGESPGRMDFQETAPARQMMEQQEQMLDRMESMREEMEDLERAMERAGLRDGELLRRMEELRRLQDEMMTPELRAQLEQMRKAVEDLDPKALQDALERMAQQQEQMKEQLDRSLELMRRAAAEQEMNNLAQQARELATQQQALAQSMEEQRPSPEAAKTQQDLAARADELAAEMKKMEEQLREQGEEPTAQSTQQAQSDAQKAGQQMQQAAADASKQDGASAAARGEQAAEQLERAADTLDRARQEMAEGWKQETLQTMQQAAQDALSLAEQQQNLLERMKQNEQAGQQQAGQQQAGQQQAGQQQAGQQQGGQQQGGQQQGGQQQGGQQQGGQQQGGQQGQTGQQGQQGGSGSGSGSGQMKSDQNALQQGLQQLGRNLQEAGESSAMVNRDVGSSLARANMSMQQTLEAMQQGQSAAQQMQQAVDALNRLALSLLNNSQQIQKAQSGTGAQQAMQQMADAAKQQGSVNGQTNSLQPMNLSQGSTNQQMNRLAEEQMEIARRLGSMNQGGAEGLLGDINALAREAEELARQLQGGQLPPDVLARQERLFHRMLDAGRSLEKDEIEEERTAERGGSVRAANAAALDPRLFQDPTRFRAPTAEELNALSPAYRRLILDYFEKLNRPLPPSAPASPKPPIR